MSAESDYLRVGTTLQIAGTAASVLSDLRAASVAGTDNETGE